MSGNARPGVSLGASHGGAQDVIAGVDFVQPSLAVEPRCWVWDIFLTAPSSVEGVEQGWRVGEGEGFGVGLGGGALGDLAGIGVPKKFSEGPAAHLHSPGGGRMGVSFFLF